MSDGNNNTGLWVGGIVAALVALAVMNSGGPDVCEERGYKKGTAGHDACIDFHNQEKRDRQQGL